jgi:hypothetical protein
MKTVPICDAGTIASLASALSRAALGRPIAFVFEEGVHRIVDDGNVYEMPNGTATLKVFISGGAQDSGAEVVAE